MTEYTYVLTDSNITIYIDGQSYSADTTHANYNKILKHVKKGIKSPKKTAKMIELFDTKTAVKKYLKGAIEVSNEGILTYKGSTIDNVLTKKIIKMMNEGFNVEPILNFLINLRKNPSHAAQNELMLFMEANDMPLTPDGHLLAYKSVNSNYKDIHSGTFDNSIGAICEMERLSVDDDRHRTCSAGLHFAAKEYATGFGGPDCHLMVLKIDPKDIVAIPSDYNNQKGRCCRYEVIDEVVNDLKDKNEYDSTAVKEEARNTSQWWSKCGNCENEQYISSHDEPCNNCDDIDWED